MTAKCDRHGKEYCTGEDLKLCQKKSGRNKYEGPKVYLCNECRRGIVNGQFKLVQTDALPEAETNVKISVCGTCNGVVRVAVAHLMNKKSKSEFAKEVMQYNLSVKEKPLLEYQKEESKWCKCK